MLAYVRKLVAQIDLWGYVTFNKYRFDAELSCKLGVPLAGGTQVAQVAQNMYLKSIIP